MENLSLEYLYKLAFTDILTGLKNRNAYEEKLIELRKDDAVLDNLTAFVIDIDNLRFINNKFGHHCGDEAIHTIGLCISEAFGEDSLCYRIGGDEFVLLVYSDYKNKLENFNKLMQEKQADYPYPLSVSIGFSEYDKEKFKNIDDLIKVCDKNMYNSKNSKKQKN